MKKQITMVGFSTLLIIALLFIAANTQDDKKQDKNRGGQKEQKQDKPEKGGKSHGNDKRMQDDKNQNKNKESNNGKDNIKEKDYKDERNGNKGKDKDDAGKRNDERERNSNDRNDVMKNGYKWDRETFRDREKYRKGDKVTLCHKFRRGDEPAVTIRVSSNSLNSHLKHGDIEGECPVTSENRYSNGFLRKRTDYYNTVQNNYEQVSYSRSILDYATQRLTGARQQLSLMQNNNTRAEDIARKQATVVELEQNVSLLQTLVGVAANLIANKMD